VAQTPKNSPKGGLGAFFGFPWPGAQPPGEKGALKYIKERCGNFYITKEGPNPQGTLNKKEGEGLKKF